MRIQLEFPVPATPDAAWAVLTSPESVARAYAPAIGMQPETTLPVRWRDGDSVVVRLSALGTVPAGRQLIEIHTRRRGSTRILEDSGRPLSGPLAIVTSWRHRMAVTPLPDGTTLYRDRLDVSAGPATPVVWFGLWLVWRLRGVRIRSLMRGTP